MKTYHKINHTFWLTYSAGRRFLKKYLSRVVVLPICLLTLSMTLSSCKKSFLDKKPDQSLLVPKTLADFKAILDDNNTMNQSPYLPAVSTDDIYTTDAGFESAAPMIKNSYLWASDIYQEATVYDWNIPYQQVFNANIVLDGLKKLHPGSAEQQLYNTIKGRALFHRAFAFYNLAQEFTAPYTPATAQQLPGIPIRLIPDVNIKSVRGTLQQTYDQIISDFAEAADLLPQQVSFVTEPTSGAAKAMLARTYLIMQKYELAKASATEALKIQNTLLDYNNFDVAALRPFPRILPTNGNIEVLFFSPLNSLASFLTSPSLTFIDQTLYNSYDDNDLRKSLFFSDKGGGKVSFRGNYTNGVSILAGIATDEVYFIRSEALARLEDKQSALNDLNTVLSKRWKAGTFIPFEATSSETALSLILNERRKELIYRNMRWSDLKRLNLDMHFETTIMRTIKGTTYTLQPKDRRYAFPIPDDEVSRSGLAQNPR